VPTRASPKAWSQSDQELLLHRVGNGALREAELSL